MEYTRADTWYPSWAADGNMYSPWTDGYVTDTIGSYSGGVDAAVTGYATIVGDDPLRLQVINPGVVKASAAPYGGRYPCGSLVYKGVWYYGTYCLMNEAGSLNPGVETETGSYNWGVLGPFVGFRTSTDLGKTWTETTHTPAKPLFPEPAQFGGKVKIGSPHFVDFGKDMEHSPDGNAYLVAHGAGDPDAHPRPANLSWITGDQIYLLRVKPSIETINDASAYEFFGGHDANGQPIWTHDFAAIKPLLDYNDHCGCVTVTYDAPLKKYLMCMTDGGVTIKTFDTYVLEADQITGPWRLVSYLAKFGMQGYFVNFPTKFISRDGRTLWLCYAANYVNQGPGVQFAEDPAGSHYGMCLQEVKLLSRKDVIYPDILKTEDNIARRAQVTASSIYRDTSAEAAVDGAVGGWPLDNDLRREWVSKGEREGAMLYLTWSDEPTIDRIWLFDRPNNVDQITSAKIIFSDGTTCLTGPLPDNASTGVEMSFSPKKVSWLCLVVTGVKENTQNIGLSEIAVFRSRGKP
jgi:hypothetical protein